MIYCQDLFFSHDVLWACLISSDTSVPRWNQQLSKWVIVLLVTVGHLAPVIHLHFSVPNPDPLRFWLHPCVFSTLMDDIHIIWNNFGSPNTEDSLICMVFLHANNSFANLSVPRPPVSRFLHILKSLGDSIESLSH